MTPEEKAEDFLERADEFKLGSLVTEQQHPKTRELSEWAKGEIPRALKVIQEIDEEVLRTASKKAAVLEELAEEIEATRATGGRVYLSGCGATGRLSLTLEFLWRESYRGESDPEGVVAFMAGGDLALVKAIEDFEDHPEYGARQLRELGFSDGDMLIAITEGGETPFVIGTVEEAADISSRSSYFIYCNPDDVLRETVERSRRVLDDARIKRIDLTTGQQVLSGSTRMQASTIQMYALGLALFPQERRLGIAEAADRFSDRFGSMDVGFLEPFIEKEAAVYDAGEFVNYEAREYGMCVVTDTTERAPTFSLAPFENFDDKNPTPSWAYLTVPGTNGAEEAWRALLGRAPRALEWDGIEHIAGRQRLLGYDFSARAPELRKKVSGASPAHTFRVYREGEELVLEFEELTERIDISGLSRLEEYTLLKVILNTHSTLLMGRLGRYESNVMLWVRPSNYKLIDRSVRYIQGLLNRDGIDNISYEDTVRELFRTQERMNPDRSIVWETYRALGGKRG
jgi:N-acetylmuramic acid 6-phosphate etherase